RWCSATMSCNSIKSVRRTPECSRIAVKFIRRDHFAKAAKAMGVLERSRLIAHGFCGRVLLAALPDKVQSPILVIALRIIGSEMRPARFDSRQRRRRDQVTHRQHVLKLPARQCSRADLRGVECFIHDIAAPEGD